MLTRLEFEEHTLPAPPLHSPMKTCASVLRFLRARLCIGEGRVTYVVSSMAIRKLLRVTRQPLDVVFCPSIMHCGHFVKHLSLLTLWTTVSGGFNFSDARQGQKDCLPG